MWEQKSPKIWKEAQRGIRSNSEFGDERRGHDLDSCNASIIPPARQSTECSPDRRDRHGYTFFVPYTTYLFSWDIHWTLLSFTLKLNQFSRLAFIHRRKEWKKKKHLTLFLLGSLGTTAIMNDQEVHDWPSASEETSGHWCPSPWDRNLGNASQNVSNHTRCLLCRSLCGRGKMTGLRHKLWFFGWCKGQWT